jgi:alpha-D-ribose 1-methylphosphonate 5-triphosphate synthase subunit PhnH
MSGILTAGFSDPAAESQACFRAVLDAMARPGRIHRIHGPADPPPPLGPATAAALLTLVDNETPLWLGDGTNDAAEWIAFHCGAPIISDPRTASFALALTMPDLTTLPAGTHEQPENSATLILQVAALGQGAALRLNGPGLREPSTLRANGLPRDFATRWQANHALYPRGVDLILCAQDSVAALPRSIAVEDV